MQSRRLFLKRGGLAAASMIFAERILADPYRPLPPTIVNPAPVRVRGMVRSGMNGLGNVAVTDGYSVVSTESDGSFELLTTTQQEHVAITLPSGHEIPRNSKGTARLYQPIRPSAKGEMEAIFELEQSKQSDEDHAFFLMADPQTLDENDVALLHAETVPDVVESRRRLGSLPLFGVTCGDIMFDRLQYYPEYERAVGRMGIACFQVFGNHDVEVMEKTDARAARTFRDHFGPTYYSFDRGEIHYIVLDDIFWFGGYIGYLDEPQLTWLAADLGRIEAGKTVVVFTHIPAYCETHVREGERNPSNSVVITNRELLYHLLEPFKATIICGHMHESEYLSQGGAEIHICGAVCGAWWSGPICDDGTPNGYSIYTVNGSSLSWEYKSTGLKPEHQFRSYKRGSVPEFPDDVAVNVWSADKHWKVEWFEQDVRKGLMERRIAKDPLSVQLHAGPNLPKRHSWVEPARTDHIFFAKPSPGIASITVEVTDRWGRKYSESVTV